jgi:hypothetical protein
VKTKPVTPYQRLLDDCRRYLSGVRFPHTKSVWTYPKARLDEGWNLAGLYQHIAAGELLGYDTILKATDAGIEVKFRKRPDEGQLPWSLK